MVSARGFTRKDRETLGYNPDRTEDLFALTPDGYIIAQDIACQHEYVDDQRCPHCGAPHHLLPIASINRSFQGLSEMVVLCDECGQRSSFIFDISNTVYQTWLAERLGEFYTPTFDGEPRVADPEQRYFM